MKYRPLLFLLLGFGIARAAEPGSPDESCEQIREQIRAHTGLPTKPNTTLLGKVGAHEECRFTSAEAYRAAWGDKPLPQDQGRNNRHKKHRHDD
jgi:hypothetical protein